MPKQVYKSDQFHGGLNSNSDPRDIADNEFPEATDVMIDEIGRIRTMGGTALQGITNRTNQINPGYGLFAFSHDLTKAHVVSGPTATGNAGMGVASYTITNGGTGYTTASPNPTTVTVGAGEKTSAVDATVTISTGQLTDGVITGTSINVSSGYTSVPAVAVTPTGRIGPSFTFPTVNGVQGGLGYTGNVDITFSDGGSNTTGAATGNVVNAGSEGYIGSITVTNAGAGYSSAPNVIIPWWSGSPPTREVIKITVTNAGSLYTSIPTVVISDPGGGGVTANATAVMGTVPNHHTVVSVTVNSGGSNYTSVPTVSFTPTNGGSGAAATPYITTQATATAGSLATNASITAVMDTSATVLTDVDASFQDMIGWIITNDTDSSSSVVTANTSTTVTGALSGGTSLWEKNDAYTISNTVSDSGDNYIAFSEPDTAGTVDIYSSEDTEWGSPIIGMTDNTIGLRKDAFYIVDGVLRISDGEFGNINANKWFGFVHSKLYQRGYRGTQTAANDGSSPDRMTDTSAAFIAEELIGAAIKNITDGSEATITANTTNTVDGILSGGSDNSWDQYDLYIIPGVPKHLIDKYVSTEQELKSLDELNIDLVLDDCTSANPDATNSVLNSTTRIVIGWWGSGKDLENAWNGQYYIGISPVYMGGQEGPISIPDYKIGSGNVVADPDQGTVALVNQNLNIQLYICKGTSTTVVDNETHLLGDDRIIGLRLYYRSFPSETWFLLKEIDLLSGGKEQWGLYNATDNLTTGYISGSPYANFKDPEVTMTRSGVKTVSAGTTTYNDHDTDTHTNVALTGGSGSGVKATVVVNSGSVSSVSITTAGSGYAVADVLTIRATKIGGSGDETCNVLTLVYLTSYGLCTANIEVDIGSGGLGTYADGSDRKGIIRVTGFKVSSMYSTEINLNDTNPQSNIIISGAMLPSAGLHTFTFQILDEFYNVLHKETETLDISDSGAEVPPDPSDDPQYES